MKLRNHQDFWAGVMFIVLGVLFMGLSWQYQMGTAAKMGPGYFPIVLGGLLAVLGLLIAAGRELYLLIVAKRELFVVLLGIALFAFLLPKLGMVISLWILIFVSALASHEFAFKETVLSAIALSVLGWAVFAKGLELQMPVWPPFLTR